MSSGVTDIAGEPKLRVFFIPFFASGHMIPILDLARLFAARRGVESTLLLTPANAALLRPFLSLSPVRLLLYPFPSAASGLPPGLENLSSVPASDSWKIYKAADLSRDEHDRILRAHRPDAVVADIPFWWTTSIARDLGIPRVTFHAVGVFPQCVMDALVKSPAHQRAAADSDPFLVPDFPGPPIELVRSELPNFLRFRDHLTDAWDRIKKSQLESYGVVINTLYELERDYCDLFRIVDCARAWFVGPLALCRREGGREGGEVVKECMDWLEKKEKGSVVLVCFGSWCHFEDAQLREMALGLEACGKAFIWVVRGGHDTAMEWMPEGWQSRTRGRGLLIKGWAPQSEILAHEAVGCFMTHCGWNSVLEALSSGKPVLTWPLVFEQFINERLVVDVLGVGKRVWGGFRGGLEEEKVVVPGEVIGRAVIELMEGQEGVEASTRAQGCAEMARAAVAEGGSSHRDLNLLIDELFMMKDGNLRENYRAG